MLDRLRDAAEEHDLTFAPDPATHSRCTLGGMIGNNSCGVHALMGGKTVDNIESLDILLYDGTRLTVGATTEAELQAIIAGGGRRGEIYAGLARIRDTYSDLIRQRFPKIPRRVSGYNLDELLPENGFNVARALVGTEGTCVTVLQARCALKHSPQHRRLVVLGFADPFIAADHVPAVLEYKPIGLEGFDGLLVDYMLRKHLAVDDVLLLPEGRGFLLCEFGADSAEEADAIAEDIHPGGLAFGKTCTVRRYSDAEAQAGLAGARIRPGRYRLRSRGKAWMGRLGGFRRAAGAAGQLSARALPADRTLRLQDAHVRPLRPGLRSPAHHLRPGNRRRASPNIASLSIRPPTSSSPMADRCPANMGTGRPAARCCRKCTARS